MALERDLGVRLFERDHRSRVLTPPGLRARDDLGITGPGAWLAVGDPYRK
jgi:hypothetical protein